MFELYKVINSELKFIENFHNFADAKNSIFGQVDGTYAVKLPNGKIKTWIKDHDSISFANVEINE